MCPNTWPPVTPYVGQTFMQAPQRMQFNASRKIGSARIRVLPLSKIIT